MKEESIILHLPPAGKQIHYQIESVFLGKSISTMAC